MKHYLLSIQQPDGGPASPELLEPVMREVGAFNQELRAAGAWVFAGGLEVVGQPGAAAVVRVRDGDVLVTDGPLRRGLPPCPVPSVIARGERRRGGGSPRE
jgi:hypothetical protein